MSSILSESVKSCKNYLEIREIHPEFLVISVLQPSEHSGQAGRIYLFALRLWAPLREDLEEERDVEKIEQPVAVKIGSLVHRSERV